MKNALFFSAAVVLATTLPAEQTPTPKWTITSPFEQKEFIQNEGQYAIKEKSVGSKDIVFGARQDGLTYFFTKDGLWIEHTTAVKRTEREIERAMHEAGVKESAEEGKEEQEWQWKFVKEFHRMQFIDANPNAELYGVNEVRTIHNFYTDKPIAAHAWKKLVYKNLYPGIDMEFIFPADRTGFKYTFIVHAGADPSIIKIKYPENKHLGLLDNGDMQITSALGEFVDHAPVANDGLTAKAIDCSFTLSKGLVGFSANGYNSANGLIIDPFTSVPNFGGTNNAYDVDWDNGGNCYVYGGSSPYRVLKFSPTGVQLWSHTMSFSSGSYYGDFAVDHNTGACYVVDGFNSGGAQAIKLNTNGTQVAMFNGNSLFQEMWRISINRCTNQAVIAGGGTSNPSYTGCYLDTNLANMNPVNVINSSTGLHDMWGLALDAFGKAYFATAQTIVGSAGYDNIIYKVSTPALTPIIWQTPEGYLFKEVGSITYAPGPPNGFNGMAVSNTNLYTYDSYVLKKWNTATGGLITSLNVNGSSAVSINYGGIDADDCDNLFLGVNSTIRQYSSALSLVGTISAPGTVYDVQLGKNNILYSCGANFVMATQVNLLPCSILQPTAAITNGGCSTPGSATVTVNGGTPPYTITWNSSPPQSGPVLSSVPSGTYIATILDNSCIKQTTYDTVIITAGGSAALTVNSGTVCPGNPIQLVVSGATTYTWSASSSLAGGLNSATVTATPTITTSYTVTGSSSTCTGSVVATVTVNPLPTIGVNAATICQNQQTATLTATGAASYVWSPGTGLSSTSTSTVTASPPSTTIYTVTGTDANGCANTATAQLTVNIPPSPAISNNSPVCLGATMTMSTSVGTSWSWTGPNGFTSALQNPSVPNAQIASSGSYSVTVTDANGCIGSTSAPFTVNPLPNPTASNNSPVCQNQTLTFNAGGGVSYSWSGPVSFSSSLQNPSLAGATPAANGTYTVTVTDANSCVNSTVTSVTVNPLPIVTATGTTVCENASIGMSSSGGISYAWSGPNAFSSTVQNPVLASASLAMNGVYTVTATDANNCSNSNTATVTVNALPVPIASNNSPVCSGATFSLSCNSGVSWTWSGPAGYNSSAQNPVVSNSTTGMTGTYTVNMLDANGCAGSSTTSVLVNPLPAPTANSNSPVCVNGNLTLNAGGGVSYSWSGPAAFTSALQSPSIAGVAMTANGDYTVTVTDNNGCVNVTTVSVVINPLPVVSATGATVCANGTINLSSTGGVSYSWGGPNGFTSSAQSPVITSASALMAGAYVVTATDGNNCSNSNSANVVVNPLPVPTPTNNAPVCSGFNINLSCNVGTSWSWAGPNNYSSTLQNPTINSATPASSGVYTVNVIDANGCGGSGTTNVNVYPLPVPSASNSGPVCTGTQLTFTATGGNTYTWSGPSNYTATQANPVISNTSVGINGTYTATVTDLNGCVSTATTAVVIYPLPVITVNSTTICIGSSNLLQANGGVNYTWNPVVGLSTGTGSGVIASPVTTSTYVVTGTDNLGCVNTATSTVVVNPLPVISVNNTAICAGQTTGTLTASGAQIYMWSPSSSLSAATGSVVIANPSATQTYTVLGTDSNGCVNSTSGTVTVNPLPVLAITPQTFSGCAPVCTQFANTNSATGSCSWNFGDGNTSTACSPVHCFVGQGTFLAVLTLTDANTCYATASATVNVFPVPDADFNATPQPTSVFEPVIHFADISSGAVINSWSWTFGDAQNSTSNVQNPVFDYGSAGSYPATLTVVSDKGCRDSIVKIIKIDDDFALYIPNAFSPNGDGTNDLFFAKGEGVKDFKIYIFDRWGNLVFYADDMNKGWDGTVRGKGSEIVQEDVYVWKVELKTYKGDPRQLKGTVSVVR